MASSKPFESVLLKAAVGRLDILEFMQASREAKTFAELENIIRRDTGGLGCCYSSDRCQSAQALRDADLRSRQPKLPSHVGQQRRHIIDVGDKCSPCSLREAT